MDKVSAERGAKMKWCGPTDASPGAASVVPRKMSGSRRSIWACISSLFWYGALESQRSSEK
eukprot:8378608-Alexandrium_andersonii.AAC.1